MVVAMSVQFNVLPIVLIFVIAFGVFFWLARGSFKGFFKSREDKEGEGDS